MPNVVGIDLGTTNSVMSYLENGQQVIILNSMGNRVTPSIVAFSKNGEVIVGEAAKNQAVINSERTVIGIKRKMGSKEAVEIDGKGHLPQMISSYLLSKLKKDAEEYFGEKVTEAVITVPAYFSDAQRQATVDAGRIAGLKVLRIINEPTAAALAYGINKEEAQTILVFDLGGGTFDVSVLELDEGVFEVKATAGNNKLGGMDFDIALRDVIIEQFKSETGINITKDRLAIQKLNEEVEKAKISLSMQTETSINIPFISADEKGPIHLSFEIKRSEFESLIEDHINETIELTKLAIKDAGIQMEDIDKIVLVGGSTRIPLVIKKIEKSIGKKVFKGINPDEVVAEGAAIQTGIIKGDVTGVVLVDVNPLSLGIEVEGGGFIPIIKRNSPIPNNAKKVFTTTVDDQEEVEVHILQGERKLIDENISLGRFILSGIRKAPKGVPRIEVNFDIDVNSIVNVSAKDLDTGLTQQVEVNARVGFSKDEIELLIKEAKKHYKEDSEKIKFIELLNDAKIIISNIKKLKNILPLKKEISEELEELIIDTQKWIEEKNNNKLERCIDILEDFHKELAIYEKEVNNMVASNN